jgi:hypothetical protein
VRSLVEHVFAAQKRRMGLVVRCIDLARATARITPANFACNMRRLVWTEGRAAPALHRTAHAQTETHRSGARAEGLEARRHARHRHLSTLHRSPRRAIQGVLLFAEAGVLAATTIWRRRPCA